MVKEMHLSRKVQGLRDFSHKLKVSQPVFTDVCRRYETPWDKAKALLQHSRQYNFLVFRTYLCTLMWDDREMEPR